MPFRRLADSCRKPGKNCSKHHDLPECIYSVGQSREAEERALYWNIWPGIGSRRVSLTTISLSESAARVTFWQHPLIGLFYWTTRRGRPVSPSFTFSVSFRISSAKPHMTSSFVCGWKKHAAFSSEAVCPSRRYAWKSDTRAWEPSACAFAKSQATLRASFAAGRGAQ